METFLLNLLKTSLLGSLAILAILVLKPLWRERYRAKTRCWLWLALAAFLLLPVDFSVKNAPVQAAPPKDYTLFVGTDKTAIQSTDNLFGDMAEKSGQSPAQVRDTIIQRPVTNPEQKTTRYIPVTTILFSAISRARQRSCCIRVSPTPSSAARCAAGRETSPARTTPRCSLTRRAT